METSASYEARSAPSSYPTGPLTAERELGFRGCVSTGEKEPQVPPPKLMKTSSCSATTLLEAPPSPLSSRPERTRISYFALLATTTYAVSRKGNRMKLINATSIDRKSGGAQWRDLRFFPRVLTHPL